MLPGPPPSLADGRVSFTLFRLECIELGQGGRGGLRPVDRLQIGHDDLAIFPQHKGQRIADQMNDAGLHRGLREHRTDRLGKTPRFREGRLLSPSTTAIRTSLTPRVLSSFFSSSKNLAPSVCSIHSPSTSFSPALLRASDIDGLVTHQALVPKLDPQVEENYIGAQRVGKDLAQPELELALPVRGSAIVSR